MSDIKFKPILRTNFNIGFKTASIVFTSVVIIFKIYVLHCPNYTNKRMTLSDKMKSINCSILELIVTVMTNISSLVITLMVVLRIPIFEIQQFITLSAGSGTVDFDEFTEAILKAMAPPNSDELRKTFKSMDTNGDGTLSLEELQDALKSVGQPLSNEGLRDLFESLDTNKNGVIDFEGKIKFISYIFYSI